MVPQEIAAFKPWSYCHPVPQRQDGNQEASSGYSAAASSSYVQVTTMRRWALVNAASPSDNETSRPADSAHSFMRLKLSH